MNECIFCGPDHPDGLRHSDAEIRAYERGRAEAAQGAVPRTMSASIPPDLAERWGMCAECSHSPGNHGGVILRTPGKPCYVHDCKCPGYRASEGAASRAEGQRLDWAEITEEHTHDESTETATEERETVARWMIAHGYATGHGDTTDDLLSELESQWGAAPRAEGLDPKDIDADIEYVREAMKIGAISYDGDSWYAASDEGGAGLGYDHCEAAIKQGFAALNRLAAILRPSDERVPHE